MKYKIGVKKHFSEHIFSMFTDDKDDKWINKIGILCSNDAVYALSEDYEPKSEFKPDWQEFDIDDKGFFTYDGHQYYYREDARFETENHDKFKGFGGWVYKSEEDGKNYWATVPQMMLNGDLYEFLREDVDSNQSCVPAIPIKIRFYRYKE